MAPPTPEWTPAPYPQHFQLLIHKSGMDAPDWCTRVIWPYSSLEEQPSTPPSPWPGSCLPPEPPFLSPLLAPNVVLLSSLSVGEMTGRVIPYPPVTRGTQGAAGEQGHTHHPER